jgi:uncharacterized protein YdeI (YjbR/CyaY-like superfamily)
MSADVKECFARGCGRCPRFGTQASATRIWTDGLAALRRTCRAAALSGTVKWGHPGCTHAGRDAAPIGAVRGDFRLSLSHAARPDAAAHLLEPAGPNARGADTIRFAALGEVEARAADLRALLAEAMDHASAGRIAPKRETPLELPKDPAGAFDADPALAAGFAAPTPGCRRSNVATLSSAWRAATRARRSAAQRPCAAPRGRARGRHETASDPPPPYPRRGLRRRRDRVRICRSRPDLRAERA